jgi:hypothetical protein
LKFTLQIPALFIKKITSDVEGDGTLGYVKANGMDSGLKKSTSYRNQKSTTHGALRVPHELL